jgi:hypothetical protein
MSDMAEKMTLELAMRRAYALGQTYWQQADSEFYSQNKKADETTAKFNTLLRETLAAHLTQPAQAVDAQAIADSIDPIVIRLHDVTAKLEAANALLCDLYARFDRINHDEDGDHYVNEAHYGMRNIETYWKGAGHD